MEIEVGMYVRTIFGISKITKYECVNTFYVIALNNEKGNCFWNGRNQGVVVEDIIGKPSFNVIDLLEVGDLIYVDISPDDCGGIVTAKVLETLYELYDYKYKISSGKYILKGIVTKEQLLESCFEVTNE